jgi:4-amino-4-deoxy-L-arabinose transferase-like glycosyltransferase
VLAALVIVVRLPSFFEPHHYGDEGVFAATAQRLLQGHTLYREAWDDKPPLVFLIYAGVLWLFGPSMLALRILGALWAAATTLIVRAIGRRAIGPGAGWAAALVVAVLAALPFTESTLLLTEALAALPSAAAILAVMRNAECGMPNGKRAAHHRADSADPTQPAQVHVPYAAVAGALLGVAFLFKQVAALDAVAVGLWLLLRRGHPLRNTLLLACGWCLPVAAAALWLASGGALADAWHAVFGFYSLYLREGSATPPAFTALKLAPAGLALAWALWIRRRTGSAGSSELLLLWFGFAVLGATLAGRPFGHYLVQVYAPAALLIGMIGPHPPAPSPNAGRGGDMSTAVEERSPLPALGEGSGVRAFSALLLTLALIIVLAGFRGFWWSHPTLQPAYYANWLAWAAGWKSRDEHDRTFSWRVANQNELVRLIAADGGERTLFVWGEYPWLYPLTDSHNPTRYTTSYHTSFVPQAKAEVLRDLECDPPQYIAQELEEWRRLPGLTSFLESRYQPMARVDNTVLWRRRD